MTYANELRNTISDDITYEDYLAIRNILTGQKLAKKFDQFVESQIGQLTRAQQNYVIQVLKAALVANDDKEELMNYILGDDKITAESLNKVGFGLLTDLLPSNIRNNSAFNAILDDVLEYNEQRVMGKVELFFLLFGKNAAKPNSRGDGKKGDVAVDGLHVEIKANNGTIHGGKGGVFEAGNAQALNENILSLAKECGYDTSNAELIYSRLAPGGTAKTEGGNWLWKFLLTLDLDTRTDVLAEYLTGMYHLSDNESKSLATQVAKNIGNEEGLKSVFTPIIFDLYKEEEKFDVLMAVDIKTRTFTTNLSGKQLSRYTKFGLPTVGRGKSTQAVPDGAIGVGVDKKSLLKAL